VHKKYRIFSYVNAQNTWPHIFQHMDSPSFTWFTFYSYSFMFLLTHYLPPLGYLFIPVLYIPFISLLQVVLGPQNMLLQPFPCTNLLSYSLTVYSHSTPNPSTINVWNIFSKHTTNILSLPIPSHPSGYSNYATLVYYLSRKCPLVQTTHHKYAYTKSPRNAGEKYLLHRGKLSHHSVSYGSKYYLR
jgi:hypothetical protein